MVAGGMRGCWGACMANRGVWQRGACVAKGVCVGYDEIQRYDQLAGGTHPTGIHSCMFVCRYVRTFQNLDLDLRVVHAFA